jgi:hypothetical protein
LELTHGQITTENRRQIYFFEKILQFGRQLKVAIAAIYLNSSMILEKSRYPLDI